MRRRDRLALLLFVGIFLLPAVAAWQCADRPAPPVTGCVIDADGPVVGARVGWQGEAAFVLSDGNGSFRLRPPRSPSRHVTATRAGYRIAAALPGPHPLALRLEPLPVEDNDEYRWQSPHPDPAQPTNCGNCHGEVYREWRSSAHARAAQNPRLRQLIADPDGRSPPGWDLSRAHEYGVAVCAKCHAPTFDTGDDLREVQGVAADGVHCDYCHKIVEAPTDRLGRRFGRDGLRLLRPRQDDQLFFGPLPDAVRRGESFAHLPLYRGSRICASCHEGVVFGVHVYGTYSEWLASPAKEQGIQCQSCHMTPTGRLTNLAPGHGGVERDPRQLASHRLPGGQAEMLRRCLKADVSCTPEAGRWRVDVAVQADNVGHRVPTGFIDRHLVLLVQAFDADGAAVRLADGPRLPDAAGTWSGKPGWLYAKVLRDAQGQAPRPFWLPGLDLADTRLRPSEPDRRSFTFAVRPARVVVQLWYRRFWQPVAAARGWADNDMLVLERTVAP